MKVPVILPASIQFYRLFLAQRSILIGKLEHTFLSIYYLFLVDEGAAWFTS